MELVLIFGFFSGVVVIVVKEGRFFQGRDGALSLIGIELVMLLITVGQVMRRGIGAAVDVLETWRERELGPSRRFDYIHDTENVFDHCVELPLWATSNLILCKVLGTS